MIRKQNPHATRVSERVRCKTESHGLGDDAVVVGACPFKVLRSSLNTNNERSSLGLVECTAATIESDGNVPVRGTSDILVWLWHSASTSEISGREIWGGCNTLRHVGITSLVLKSIGSVSHLKCIG